MSTVQYYDAEQVRKVLTWPMVNAAITAAFVATSNAADEESNQSIEENSNDSYANQPTRTITECGKRSQLLFTMPAFVGNYKLENSKSTRNTLACKLVTSFPENSIRNPPLPNILAHILLFNSVTGTLESVVEGTQITAWRTASASVVATKYLFFGRECEVATGASETDIGEYINLAIIGCGVQGTSHALGMCATFKVANVKLWNRTESKAENLATLLKKKFREVNVTVCADPAEAVADADVVCIATYSPHALIRYDMIKKDAVHINTAGAGQIHFGEVAQDIYDVADVYIDSTANAKVELQDLKANIVGEVGEVIRSGKCLPKNGITIFQSMGMAAEDATVSHAVVDAIKRAKARSEDQD